MLGRGRARAGFSYYRFESKQDGHTLTSDRRDHLLQVLLSLGYDSRDRWSDPHTGWLNEVEIRRTGGPLQGDGDFWTGHVDLRRFQPLRHGHTLCVSAILLSLQSARLASIYRGIWITIWVVQTPFAAMMCAGWAARCTEKISCSIRSSIDCLSCPDASMKYLVWQPIWGYLPLYLPTAAWLGVSQVSWRADVYTSGGASDYGSWHQP